MSRAINEKDIDRIIRELTEAGYEVEFEKAGDKHIRRAFRKVGEAQGEEVIQGFDFDIDTTDAQKAIARIEADFSVSATETTLKDIKRVLKKAVADGASIHEAAGMIREHATTYAKRAEMIARNEIVRAANRGTIEAFRQSGVVVEKQWLCAPDCCPICAPYDGTTVPLDKPFWEKGSDVPYVDEDGNEQVFKADYGDVEGGNLHVNCRCTILGVIG